MVKKRTLSNLIWKPYDDCFGRGVLNFFYKLSKICKGKKMTFELEFEFQEFKKLNWIFFKLIFFGIELHIPAVVYGPNHQLNTQ